MQSQLNNQQLKRVVVLNYGVLGALHEKSFCDFLLSFIRPTVKSISLKHEEALMSQIKIIAKITLSDQQYSRLLELGLHPQDIAVDNPPHRQDVEEIIRRIGNAEAIVINISTVINKEVIERCKTLKFIQTWSTGLDNIDIETAQKAGIIIKNVPDFSIESVAEKTLSLMIFIANQMKEANISALNGEWNYTKFQGVELKGKNLTIVGKGYIGSRVAELARAFGMLVTFIDSKTTKDQMRLAFSNADFITLHCPLNHSTYHLISRDEFNAMKQGVFIVNNSRGGVVDEDAFLKALEFDIVRAASVDVFEIEPPEHDNKLLNHSRVFVTPHIAWNTQEAVQRLSDACIHNLEEYLIQATQAVMHV